ncbi:MAG: ATP-binding cassette domain-containing protein [Candidatus Edwardsbacteria bacterium]
MISAENLTKIFDDPKRGEVVAAKDVSFTCEPGRIFGLLGPNGAGKTTTLRMLSTVLKPTSGTAKVAGFDIIKESQKVRKKIGFLSGDTGVYGRLSAKEMVEYFGRLYGMDEKDLKQKREKIFTLLEMNDFKDTRNDKLSTGMKQKVNIARTIIHNPPVLILDEPTLGLDVITSRTIVDFIRGCKDEGKCVLFSTHIMSEAERLCNEIAIIHKGTIFAVGNPQELKERTKTTNLEDAFLALVREN